jgi:hypothetical protein
MEAPVSESEFSKTDSALTDIVFKKAEKITIEVKPY